VKEYERPYIIHKTILTYGQGESLISDGLKPGKTAFRNFETEPASPEKCVYVFRLGEQAELLEMAIEEYVVSLNLIINDIIVGYEDDRVLVGIKKKGKTLSTAELHGR
jgi:nicotinamide-nucleotide amidase